jgi:hypothetical protein
VILSGPFFESCGCTVGDMLSFLISEIIIIKKNGYAVEKPWDRPYIACVSNMGLKASP